MTAESSWQAEQLPIHPTLRGRRSADAVIVGGGFSGLHTALLLLRAGLRVTLVEAETVGFGASGQCAGMVAVTCGDEYAQVERHFGPEYTAALQQTSAAAYAVIRELAASEAVAPFAYREQDLLLTASAPRAIARLTATHQAAQRAGLAAEWLEGSQCPIPTQSGIRVPRQAVLDPRRYVQSLVKLTLSLGLKLFEQSRVISVDSNIVYTATGSVLAPYIVIATGYPIVNRPGGYFLRLWQQQDYLLSLPRPAGFEGMYADVEGRFALRAEQGDTLLWLPGSAVGCGREDAARRYRQQYAASFGQAEPRQIRAGALVCSADGLPCISPYSKRMPNIFVQSGYGRCGIVRSMVAAQAVSAAILGLPGEGYSAYAHSREGAYSRLRVAGNALTQTGHYLRSESRLLAPRCPHYGCKLRYRPRSHTWECSCHGAKFDDIGRLLSAPPVQNAQIKHRNRRR